MEALDQVARRDQYRHASLDARNGDRVAFGEMIALAQQQPAQNPSRKWLAQPLATGALGTSTTRCPFGDDAQTGAPGLEPATP
jgi:hypothetical protein